MEHSAVFCGNGVHGVHEFEVFTLRVVHQGHGGLCQSGELCNFARVVHAQLHDRNPMVSAQAQQGEGHPDVVVQVALGRQVGVARCIDLQDGGNHLRHRGLAIAACDCNQWQLKLRAPGTCQLAQRGLGVMHFNAGQTGGQPMRLQTAAADDRNRAFALRLMQERIGVKGVALQGHKQVAAGNAAGVGVHPCDGGGRVAVNVRGCACGLATVAEPLGNLPQGHQCGVHACTSEPLRRAKALSA